MDEVPTRLAGGVAPGSADDSDYSMQSSTEKGHVSGRAPPAGALNRRDKRNLALLVVLYLLQGVPLGLTLGSLPYLLRPHLTYASLAVFTLSSYPYSLKLLWSPIVDGLYSVRIGRRKSWILPVQATVGVLLLMLSGRVADWIQHVSFDVWGLNRSSFANQIVRLRKSSALCLACFSLWFCSVRRRTWPLMVRI